MDKTTLATEPTVGWFWYDLDLYMILNNKVRLFKFALFVITFSTDMLDDFDMTLTFIWTWPTRFNYSILALFDIKLFIDVTCIWTKKHLWPNKHVGWFWYHLDLYMTLLDNHDERKYYPLQCGFPFLKQKSWAMPPICGSSC